MKLPRLGQLLPSWKNALLALIAAILLILSFPDFEFWWIAWFALVPLMWAVEREKASTVRSFFLGGLFGTTFFFGTCWWLAYAPIHYAGFPWPLAYFLLFCVTAITGLFPAIFAAILSILLRRFGSWAFLAAPFVWVSTEFLRYWLTGNNWNAIGYSQAPFEPFVEPASFGGVYLVSFLLMTVASAVIFEVFENLRSSDRSWFNMRVGFGVFFIALGIPLYLYVYGNDRNVASLLPVSNRSEERRVGKECRL